VVNPAKISPFHSGNSSRKLPYVIFTRLGVAHEVGAVEAAHGQLQGWHSVGQSKVTGTQGSQFQ